jgi:hypothetical protein
MNRELAVCTAILFAAALPWIALACVAGKASDRGIRFSSRNLQVATTLVSIGLGLLAYALR